MLWRFDLLHRIPDRKGKLTICTERRRKLPERGFRLFYCARLFLMREERLGEMTHPCPAGQGYAAGVRDRRCLPLRGKSASELARLILGGRGAKADKEKICPSRTVWQARRKTKRAVLRSMRPPRPRNHPAGRTAALPAPAQGSTLENPFWEPPVPNAAGGRPLLVGLPPSTRSTAPTGTYRSAHAPYSWGMGASTSSQRLLADRTAVTCRRRSWRKWRK